MTTPNPKTMNTRRSKVSSYLSWLLTIVAVAITILGLQLLINPDGESQHHPNRKALRESPSPLQLRALEKEAKFLYAMKSCIPSENSHCKQFIPAGTTKQRIALLSPPGKLSSWLTHFVKRTVGKKADGVVEWLPGSHIPPYGYGKTHGLTKIIRLIPSPLIVGAVDAIEAVTITATTTENKVSVQERESFLADIRSSLRQVIRWHCRISHIAAHTSVLTLTMDDVKLDPLKAARDVVDFVGVGGGDKLSLDESDGESLLRVSERAAITLKDLAVGDFQSSGTGNDQMHRLFKSFDDVLFEELRMSKDLSKWPCESFWSTGDFSRDEIQSGGPAKLARFLSPDCDGPMTECWVARDKCEHRGDAVCAEK